jgi:hypothetical protein
VAEEDGQSLLGVRVRLDLVVPSEALPQLMIEQTTNLVVVDDDREDRLERRTTIL